MASIKLELSDCLDDSPQTRALIGVFQQDADVLTEYARGLELAFQRIAYAQSELTSATQALSQHLREFDNQRFTLSVDNDYISSTMQQLAAKIDQVSTFNAVLQTQLTENCAYNSSRFVQKYMVDFQNLKAKFQANDKIHQETMKKNAKISKRRISDSQWQESTDHLHAARKGFHGSSMAFCSTLNLLQARKKTGLLEPLVGYVQAQMGFFRMGGELCRNELDEYLTKLSESLTDIDTDTVAAEKESLELMDRIDAESTRAYIPDPPPSMDFPELPVDSKLTQISGYLFARSHGVFMKEWNQRYYFTQGGNLMQQGRDEVAGGLVMDLDGSSTVPIDIDDRRYVFQITSQDSKQSAIMQAESKHKCLQWIATLNNISKGLYLANDPGKAAELMQAASQPPIVDGAEGAQKPAAESPPSSATRSERTESQTSADFESKHEAFRPAGVFERLRNAATSLMAPAPKNEDRGGNNRNQGGDGDQVSRDTTESELEAVVNAGFPILFDLPSPASQGKELKGSSGGTEADPPPEGGNVQSPARENPFSGEDGSGEVTSSGTTQDVVTESESNFRAMYVVRFIGCKQVENEIHRGYGTISESIRAIMAARALHNIFSMNELHLVVSNDVVQLIDPGTQLCRESFAVQDILQAANHRENTRLFAFIAKSPTGTGADVNMCYAFESNSDGADVCCAIATAQVMVQSLIEHDEIERQKELESDLEEQSKLLAHASLTVEGESAHTDVTHDSAPDPTDDSAKLAEEDLTMKDT